MGTGNAGRQCGITAEGLEKALFTVKAGQPRRRSKLMVNKFSQQQKVVLLYCLEKKVSVDKASGKLMVLILMLCTVHAKPLVKSIL